MKKTYIFDLDGTLVNTLADITSAVNAMLTYYGLPMHSEEAVRGMIGRGAKHLIFSALPEERRDDKFVDEALDCYRKCYDKNLIEKTFVYQGLSEVLLKLKEDGAKLAVLSNKDDRHVKEIVNTLLPNLFTVYNGFSPSFPHKPTPDAVYDIMKKLGASSNETAFIGDSAVDVQTANNAGIISVGVSWGFGGEASFSEYKPTVLIHSPFELLEL